VDAFIETLWKLKSGKNKKQSSGFSSWAFFVGFLANYRIY